MSNLTKKIKDFAIGAFVPGSLVNGITANPLKSEVLAQDLSSYVFGFGGALFLSILPSVYQECPTDLNKGICYGGAVLVSGVTCLLRKELYGLARVIQENNLDMNLVTNGGN